MNNGVHAVYAASSRQRQYYWMFDGEKSTRLFGEKQAQEAYIERLLSSPYAPLIEGKPFTDQMRIVFGTHS